MTRPHLFPSIIVAALMFGALSSQPYGYYTFLRWAAFLVGIFIAYFAFKQHQTWASWVFGLIAVVWNPLAPIYLEKEQWAPLNVAAGIMFLIGAAVVSAKPTTGDTS